MNASARSSAKIGKVVKKLFGDKFKPSGDPGSDIESFVNAYKSMMSEDDAKFEEVKGEDIRHWYLEDNYIEGFGDLNGSCMRYPNTQRYLNFYVYNPDIVSMLILRDRKQSDKIRGRALIWKLDEPDGRTFMDRIYFVSGYEVELFKRYAAKRGWIHRKKQNHYEGAILVDTKEKNEGLFPLVVSNVNATEEQDFPYMDTMKFIDMDDMKMSNIFGELDSSHTIYKLEGVDGDDYFVYDHDDDEFVRRDALSREYIRENIDEFAIMFPDAFWDSIDDDSYMRDFIETQVENEVDDLEYIYDKDELIRRILGGLSESVLPLIGTEQHTMSELEEYLHGSSIEEIADIARNNGIAEDIVRGDIEETYDGYTARDICEELYGDCDEVDEDTVYRLEQYIDKDRFANIVHDMT